MLSFGDSSTKLSLVQLVFCTTATGDWEFVSESMKNILQVKIDNYCAVDEEHEYWQHAAAIIIPIWQLTTSPEGLISLMS